MKPTQKELRQMISKDCLIYESQGSKNISMSEDGCLATVVSWFKLQYPEHANLIFHVPNEGAHQSQKRTNIGVLAGVPDLIIALPRGGYGCYAFDAKRDNKYKFSAPQVNVINDFARYNFSGYWMGVDAGKQSIIDYMAKV